MYVQRCSSASSPFRPSLCRADLYFPEISRDFRDRASSPGARRENITRLRRVLLSRHLFPSPLLFPPQDPHPREITSVASLPCILQDEIVGEEVSRSVVESARLSKFREDRGVLLLLLGVVFFQRVEGSFVARLLSVSPVSPFVSVLSFFVIGATHGLIRR